MSRRSRCSRGQLPGVPLNATFYSLYSGQGVASGTLTLDTTIGLFTNENVLVSFPTLQPSNFLFTSIYGQGDSPHPITTYPYILETYSVEDLIGPANATNEFLIEFPFASLVGYSGSAICSDTLLCGLFEPSEFVGSPGYVHVQLGSLTPVVATTPEPAGSWLLGTGLFGLGLVLRHRHSHL